MQIMFVKKHQNFEISNFIKNTISNFQDSKFQNPTFQNSNFQKFKKNALFQITRPGVHFEVPKKREVATKTIPYEIYGEILFQKVALCYLLHFVQDGSSKNALDK